MQALRSESMHMSSVRLGRLIYIGDDEINLTFHNGVMFGCQPSKFVLQ